MPVTTAHPALPEIPRAGHFVRFYDDDAFLLDEVAEFIDAALRSGGAGVVIATPQHLAILEQRLAGFGSANGHPGWHPGELVVLDAQATLDRFMIEGWPDEERFMRTVGAVVASAAEGGRNVHAFGEMVALLCAAARYDAAVRVEELWNELGRRHAFSLFCAYPARLFATSEQASAFQRVCDAHSHVCPSEHLAADTDSVDAHRLVAVWQQKASALEAEVARRQQAEQTLRRRERELADFVENAAEGLHRVAGDGTILWANRAELDLLGYSHSEYIGRHIADFHVDKPVIGGILARLQAGETLRDTPARLRCKDGSIKHVLIHSNGYFEDGKLVYTRCFTRDASDRVAREAAETERETLLCELEEANRAKDEFLAMLGHELRNPLSPIVTALQLMRMRGDTGTDREQGIIQRQVDHLVRLVDDLLDISKITRGKIELKKERVDVSDVLTKAVEMASLLLEQRSHRLAVGIEPGLRWEGDPVRLAQVVANLLTNAARYTDVGGDVRLSARRDDGAFLVIRVRDNGSGISPEVLPRIFDLFFQGKRSVDRSEGGLGIGLALVRSLVAMHGGTVEAASEGLGRGSEFTIHLPLSTGTSANDESRPDGGAAQSAPAPVSRRVLVVDDNVDGADLLGHLLRAAGHQVQVLNDPVSALQALDAFAPDVAVLDIGLPVMDGYELAARLRERLAGRPCRFIALTGYGQDADRGRSQHAGFEQHLVKPVDPDRVVEVVGLPASVLDGATM
ncbi:ATP-binding protein [Piscinibacter sp.]|uniref:ATP-binding protein n=1 Tax=Piscinibacter sp. TaxID=1903157 RepID=UPI002C669CE8|nr:ATP-binding protein [Albitalea sp.]HUG25701.1 ATP-binding protein [Albitalea sp.]